MCEAQGNILKLHKTTLKIQLTHLEFYAGAFEEVVWNNLNYFIKYLPMYSGIL